MLRVWQAYQLMSEGSGSFEMQLVTEEDVALVVRFIAPRPLTIMTQNGELEIKVGESVTIPFTFHIESENHNPDSQLRFTQYLKKFHGQR
jgi:hypothetical protein